MTLKILGITGPIGCGKSTVSAMTRELGAIDVIDADAVVHELMGANTELTREVGSAFGTHVIAADGSVDRAALGGLVFDDPADLIRLENLVHPRVRDRLAEVVRFHRETGANGILTLEAIRLLDSPVREWADTIWMVTCKAETQRARLRDLRGYSEGEADRRIDATPSFAAEGTVTIIVNDGPLEDLRATVASAWQSVVGSR